MLLPSERPSGSRWSAACFSRPYLDMIFLAADAEFGLHWAEQTKHSLSSVEVLDVRKSSSSESHCVTVSCFYLFRYLRPVSRAQCDAGLKLSCLWTWCLHRKLQHKTTFSLSSVDPDSVLDQCLGSGGWSPVIDAFQVLILYYIPLLSACSSCSCADKQLWTVD